MDEDKEQLSFARKYPKLNALIGFIILAVIVGVGLLTIRWFMIKVIAWISNIYQYTSKLDAVIIVALITGTVSVVTVFLSSVVAKIIEYRQKRREYLYQKREEPYSEFVGFIYKIIDRTRKGEEYNTEEMLSDISNFSQKITLWGSNRVINKWLKFRESAQTGGKSAEGVVFEMEEILYAMRKDMGLRKMKQGNLLSVFMNDVNDLRNSNE